MRHESLNDFWLECMILIIVQVTEHIQFVFGRNSLSWHLSQLNKEHHRQKGQLFVFMVENEQRQKVFLHKFPLANLVMHMWILFGVKAEFFEYFAQTLLTVLMFDIDIRLADLFDSAHAIDPKQDFTFKFFIKLILELPIRFVTFLTLFNSAISCHQEVFFEPIKIVPLFIFCLQL